MQDFFLVQPDWSVLGHLYHSSSCEYVRLFHHLFNTALPLPSFLFSLPSSLFSHHLTLCFFRLVQGLVVYIMLQKYLQAQSLVWVFVVAGLLVNAILVIFCAIFIVGAKMGTT